MTYRCKAVIFDMDGTLVDSTAAGNELLRTWTARHGLDSEYVIKMAQGRRNRDIVREFAPHSPIDAETAWLDREELTYSDGTVAIRGAAEMLSAIPWDMWGLVTSAGLAVAEMRMRAAGLPVPAVLISSDNVSRGKPDPEGYLLAAEWLKVSPEECLVVEDAPAGIAAAQSAGMQALGITTTFEASQLKCQDHIADFTELKIAFKKESQSFEISLRT